MSDANAQIAYPASLGRRLGAMLYDSLLVLAIWFISIGISNLLLQQPSPPWLVQTIVLFEWYLFFVYFWSRGGQTAGMRAWRLKVVAPTGEAINFATATVRFFCAAVSGISLVGLVWIFFDKEKRAWHDIWSKSVVVHMPKDSST